MNGGKDMTGEARENYRKLVTRVKEIYGDHSHIREQDNELYFIARNRYGFQTFITLTEEQVVELARGTQGQLEQAGQALSSYIEDYDYFTKQAEEASK